MTKFKRFMKTQLAVHIFWIMILTLVIIFYPVETTAVIEPEIKTESKTVYIYVPEQLKEEPTTEEVITKVQYGFTEDEKYLLTVLLCGSGSVDGDGEFDIDFMSYPNHEQVSLVLNVVMNRVKSDKFPNTVSEVVWAKNQFSPMRRWTKNNLPTVSEDSYRIVETWCDAYDAYIESAITIPESHLYFTGNGKINKSR